ncbi:hypothetical protein [Moraxella pluranimalium]|uniref:Uncharacterized protein n=1 Tax=Moraxella pluranimalium TaxID=470453 RepID=A0A1T0CUI7_9GAMM|nr:hypothetical protein [Moraxella pluranimalium]OOS25997.1 hypothetical protein B0680_01155 [Moraxella pluranimalium]
MKKFALLASLLIAQSAFAWHFSSTDYYGRSYEIVNRDGATVLVSGVRCTKTDGHDALTVAGYFSPTGRYNAVNKSYRGANVKRANTSTADVLSSYMKFCAKVNQMN